MKCSRTFTELIFELWSMKESVTFVPQGQCPGSKALPGVAFISTYVKLFFCSFWVVACKNIWHHWEIDYTNKAFVMCTFCLNPWLFHRNRNGRMQTEHKSQTANNVSSQAEILLMSLIKCSHWKEEVGSVIQPFPSWNLALKLFFCFPDAFITFLLVWVETASSVHGFQKGTMDFWCFWKIKCILRRDSHFSLLQFYLA